VVRNNQQERQSKEFIYTQKRKRTMGLKVIQLDKEKDREKQFTEQLT